MSAIFSYYPAKDFVGRGVIFDDSMQIVQEVRPPNTMIPFNMHEFYVLDNGATAMHIVQRVELADVAHLNLENQFEGMTAGLVANMGTAFSRNYRCLKQLLTKLMFAGIQEVDLHSGEAVFSWWASDHINLNTSTFPPRHLDGPYPNGWDWLYVFPAEFLREAMELTMAFLVI